MPDSESHTHTKSRGQPRRKNNYSQDTNDRFGPMASAVVPLPKAKSELDFVTVKDLSNVLAGPVPWYVKKLFEAIVKCTRPGTEFEGWPQIQELLQKDGDFISQLQKFEPEVSDQHRIRDVLYSELEITSVPSEFMAQFSPACVLLLRWCHALGDICGCPEPAFPLTEDSLKAARAEAQAAREQRAEAKAKAAKQAKLSKESQKASSKPSGKPVETDSMPQGRLHLKSVISGEVFATLQGATPAWTYKDIVDRFRPLLPEDAGDIALLAGDAPMERYSATLESLGVEMEGELLYTVLSVEAFAAQASEECAPAGTGVVHLQAELQNRMTRAHDALDSLNKADVVEVRSFHKPPRDCRLVLEAVALLLGNPHETWSDLRSMLDDKTILQRLLHMDATRIAPKVLVLVKWYIDNPDLEVERVERISRAAKTLRIWVQAVYDVALISARCRALRDIDA